MHDIFDIRRSISERAKLYVLTRIQMIVLVLIMFVSLIIINPKSFEGALGTVLLSSIFIIYFIFKNLTYFKLLKTGVLIRCNLKYAYSKNDTRHANKTNMRYIYEFKYFDIYEREHIRKIAFRNMLDENELVDVPFIFSLQNPKQGVLLHHKFHKLKIDLENLSREKYLTVKDDMIDIQGNHFTWNMLIYSALFVWLFLSLYF
ncbi:MAG: hypothetical protein N2645_22355 [Clostridia bacterium]|nr:hypothetical protein [Clostridia bacterium]